MEWVPRDTVRGYLEQSYRYGKSNRGLRDGWSDAGAPSGSRWPGGASARRSPAACSGCRGPACAATRKRLSSSWATRPGWHSNWATGGRATAGIRSARPRTRLPRPVPTPHSPRLTIAVCVDQFPELSETFVSGELQQLQKAGHRVLVQSITPRAAPGRAGGARPGRGVPGRGRQVGAAAGVRLADAPASASLLGRSSAAGGDGGARSTYRTCGGWPPWFGAWRAAGPSTSTRTLPRGRR